MSDDYYKYGTFRSRKVRKPRDLSSEAGARKLARAIKLYWMNLGYEVDIRLERIHSRGISGPDTEVWCVRSDMVDGRPRRKIGV